MESHITVVIGEVEAAHGVYVWMKCGKPGEDWWAGIAEAGGCSGEWIVFNFLDSATSGDLCAVVVCREAVPNTGRRSRQVGGGGDGGLA